MSGAMICESRRDREGSSRRLAERSRKWQARFSACRSPGRRNARPSGETNGRWGVHRYACGACLPTIVASRGASPPTSPAARRRSSRATGSCCPSPRRRASTSSKSRRPWVPSQIANEVHHADMASNQESVERAPGGRVPRHLPAHEVAVPDALFVRTLAERGVGDVTAIQVRQLADLRRKEGATLALLRRRVAGVPHEVVRDEQPATLKRVQ
jgi:hypothetical protein